LEIFVVVTSKYYLVERYYKDLDFCPSVCWSVYGSSVGLSVYVQLYSRWFWAKNISSRASILSMKNNIKSINIKYEVYIIPFMFDNSNNALDL